MSTIKKLQNKTIVPRLTKDSNDDILKCLNKYIDDFDIDFKKNGFIKFLHKSLQSAKKDLKNIVYEEQIINIDETNPHTLKSTYFLHDSIVQHIKKNLNLCYRTKMIIYEKYTFFVNIYFNAKQKVNIKKMNYYIKFLLCFCLQYHKDTEKVDFNISIYLGEIKKGLSSGFTNTIESKHINSGYYFYNPTNSTSNIVVFRREEWYKTLVHECIHCFNLDIHSSNISFKTIMSDCFYINSKMLVNEALTEFWGRTINCAILTYHGIASDTYEDFLHIYSLNLNIERMHSLYKIIKLLGIFDLEYKNVIDKNTKAISSKLYKEETNAFCYYVISGLLMFKYDNTLQWFTNNDYKTINFEKTERQVMILVYYIKQISKDKTLLELLDKLKNDKLPIKNMKMSIFELDIN